MEIDWMERGRRPSESGILSTVLRGNPDDEIVALEARLRDAQLSADVEVLDKLIHEDLLFTGPDGQLATKAQDLEAHSRPRSISFARTERTSHQKSRRQCRGSCAV